MSDWLVSGTHKEPQRVISVASQCAIGHTIRYNGTGLGTAVVQTAKRIILVPFQLDDPFTIRRMWVGAGAGGTAGNFDVGVYDEFGTYINSIGSQAYSSANAPQGAAVTQVLMPGRYFMACEHDSVNPGVRRWDNSLTGHWAMAGVMEHSNTTTFPLPTGGVTPTALAHSQIPLFGFTGSTVI